MPNVVALESLEVLVIVDNASDSISTNPKNVIPEWSGLFTGGRLRMLSGQNICCAHNGLSLLITAHNAGAKRSMLFDAGPEGATFLRNTNILGMDFGSVETVVLSHGHWDHAGGLLAAIETIAQARGEGRVKCFVHPGMFAQRASQRPNGELYVHEPVPSPERLMKAGADVVNTREPQVIGDGAFFLSGEIPRLSKYEAGLPGHLQRSKDGRSSNQDPLIIDERFISVHVKKKGRFVFSACSHAGLVNVLNHARSILPDVPLYGAMRGLHLSGATEKIIPDTINDLKGFDLKLLVPGHCTGWGAIAAMARVFGDELAPSAVGKRYLI